MTKLKALLCAALLGVCGIAGDIQAVQTLLQDTFNDGERLTQALPGSAKWYTRMAGDTLNVGSGTGNFRLETSNAATVNQFFAYFTEAGSPIVLAVGDELKLTMRVQMLVATDLDFNRGLCFGLFNSKGTRDTGDGSSTGAQRVDDAGYYVVTNPGRTTANYAKISRKDESFSTDHFVNYIDLLPAFSSYNMGTTALDLNIKVARINATQISLSGRCGTAAYVVSDVIDSANPCIIFDMVSVFVDNRVFVNNEGGVSVDNVLVEYTHAPTNCIEIWQQNMGQPADLNHDCVVNFEDFVDFASQWMLCNDPTGTCN